MMVRVPHVAMLAMMLPVVAGCTDLRSRVEHGMVEAQAALGTGAPRPGLEVLAARTSGPNLPDAPLLPLPQELPSADSLPFPQGELSLAEAEALLAGDPAAMRFLALKHLAAQGMVPATEAAARRHANLGGLLPLTAPLPPDAGILSPMPPASLFAARFGQLGEGSPASRAARQAEQDFLLDQLLPLVPGARQPLNPADMDSARKALDRLGRLKRAGLVTAAEHDAEAEAMNKLMAGGTLPERQLAPPPEEPAPKKKKALAGGARPTQRLPGGVTGKLEVIPSPAVTEAPRLTAAHKGPAGVHLLSMGTAGHGDKAWEALKTEFPELAAYSFKVQRADLGELGVTHRLIAGPMDADAAEKLCAKVRSKSQTCQPTPFPQ